MGEDEEEVYPTPEDAPEPVWPEPETDTDSEDAPEDAE